MDELPLSHIESHMGGSFSLDAEEEQIAGLNPLLADGLGSPVLVQRGSRNLDTTTRICVVDKPAAVEALGGDAAIAIGPFQLVQSNLDRRVGLGCPAHAELLSPGLMAFCTASGGGAASEHIERDQGGKQPSQGEIEGVIVSFPLYHHL